MSEATFIKVPFCNFCRKSQAHVRVMVVDKDPAHVGICDACIATCYEILQEHNKKHPEEVRDARPQKNILQRGKTEKD